MTLIIGMIVGEYSGDKIGAYLINSILKKKSNIKVIGILGPEIQKLGYKSSFNIEELSSIGFFKPIFNLIKFIKIKKFLLRLFIKNSIDIFIGIDFPDFNLIIENKLKKINVPVIHYVSPTIWAWRKNRIKNIKKSVNIIFLLFPFEIKFYTNKIKAIFVGHYIVDKIPLKINNDILKKKIYFNKKIFITILLGSRFSEIENNTNIYLKLIKKLKLYNKNYNFIFTVLRKEHSNFIKKSHNFICPEIKIIILINNTFLGIRISSLIFSTSGTATLEVALYKKPLIVSYKLDTISYKLIKKLIKIPYISIPNIIKNKKIVEEFIQNKFNVKELSLYTSKFINSNKLKIEQYNEFRRIHFYLKNDSLLKIIENISKILNK